MDSACLLCIMSVPRRNAGPPTRGDRCSATLADLAADDLALVAAATGILPEMISGRRVMAPLVRARWAWWSLLQDRGLSYSAIGRLTGRDHSSVGYALERAPGCARTQAILAAVRAG
jgi:hypothetical protein